MNENASSASMQRVASTTATARIARNRIGATPRAASPTMLSKAMMAIGAWPRRKARAEGRETSTMSISAASL